jgi:hypothetical protein
MPPIQTTTAAPHRAAYAGVDELCGALDRGLRRAHQADHHGLERHERLAGRRPSEAGTEQLSTALVVPTLVAESIGTVVLAVTTTLVFRMRREA